MGFFDEFFDEIMLFDVKSLSEDLYEEAFASYQKVLSNLNSEITSYWFSLSLVRGDIHRPGKVTDSKFRESMKKYFRLCDLRKKVESDLLFLTDILCKKCS
jgi:hypothetical protein